MDDHTWEAPHIVTVKSSAGAGKTYSLARRYLQLLAVGKAAGSPARNHISNIVAITFTNRAAGEMRSRIVEWMKCIILSIPLDESGRDPVSIICGGEENEVVRTGIREAVRYAFEGLLRDFHDFKVSTIDSFVNLTLKASAFKLNLPPDFDISTESSRFIQTVLQECLQEILESKAVRHKFDRFLRSYMGTEGENVAWIPTGFLLDTISRFWSEEAKENREFAYDTGRERAEDIRKAVRAAITDLVAYLEGDPAIKPNKSFLEALGQMSRSGGFESGLSTYLRRESISACLNKGSAPPDHEYERLWQEIRAGIGRWVEALSESKFSAYIELYDLFKVVLRREITLRRRTVLIEELNKLLQQVIDGEQFVPEIYYALAERYSHFLIDEFQDTNLLQWRNMAVLVEEALSRGGTLFLVGDKKQSIYRWRGGRPELVDEVAAQYRSFQHHPVCLDTNYRSGEHIVKFNNALFDPDNIGRLVDAVMAEPSREHKKRIVETYGEAPQALCPSKTGKGYVRIEKLSRRDHNGEAPERFAKKEKFEVVGERLSRLILDLRSRGAYRDRDIAVLVRTRAEAQFVVNMLLSMGVSVESELTVNVKNNPFVKEVVGFLRFLDAPYDNLSFAGLVTGRLFLETASVPDRTMRRWIEEQRMRQPGSVLYARFRDDFPGLWSLYLEYFFQRVGYFPPYELAVLILERWDLLKRFPEEAPYFLHLCGLLKDREALGEGNLAAFLRFWYGKSMVTFGETGESEGPFLLKTTEGANAIRVLTIHKAKGLQFPVVILPFLKLTTFSASDSRDKAKFFVTEGDRLKLLYIKKDFAAHSHRLRRIYQEKEMDHLLDELNNVYVACTRPEQELYLFLTESVRQKNYLIETLFGMETLQPYRRGNFIEIGKEHGEATRGPSPAETSERHDQGAPLSFDDMGNDILWIQKMRSKLKTPESCSREQVQAKKRGDVIHYILSLVTTLPGGKGEVGPFLEGCIEAGLARYGFQRHKNDVTRAVLEFFQRPHFRDFFVSREDEAVYTEKEIVDDRGGGSKVDRILLRKDSIDVIDFKTGETHTAEHVEQIKRYSRLLEQIHPGRPVKGHLLYVDEGLVRTVRGS
jgi:ATP-dependent helicase/nuclease subunit A